MIEYRDIRKDFGRQRVLTGVDLSVDSGELLCIFGPSGTGKSVLLKTTIGLVVPDRGDVRVDGESVYFGGSGSLKGIRRKVGYVFQNSALFDSLNVFENICFGLPEEEEKRLSRKEMGRRAWEALELVNLDPRLVMEKAPSELSGGMKKRVAIARTIISRPETLLWDEPTTGLDPVNTVAVERLISSLSSELDVTSIVVTHDIEGGLAICDRVVLLEGGKVRFHGTPSEFRDSDHPVVRSFIDRNAAEAALGNVGLGNAAMETR